MIEIELTTALTLYLGLILGMIFLIALLHALKQRRRLHRFTTHSLCKCSFCGFSYSKGPDQALTRCPQCHCLSKHETRLSQ